MSGIRKVRAFWATFTVLLLLIAGSFAAAEQSEPGDFVSAQFSRSGLCSNCHGNSFGEWDGSMHSNADRDFFYQAMLQEYSIDAEAGGLPEGFCSRCHTPIGLVSGEIPPLDSSGLSDVAKEGVQCDFCHSVAESEGIGNAPYVLEPGDVKWGQRTDSESPSHGTEAHEFYNNSEYCGMCHNIYHPANNLTLAATYTEWKESPYAEEGTTCQACHMTPGIVGFEENPGKAASNGPDREHVYTHYFVGGNAFVTDVLGEGRHEKRAIEYLQHAASLQVKAPESAEPGEAVEMEVEITNSGAGHKIPSGVTEEREIWLELIATDAGGKELYHSGALDEKGKIDSGATVYHTVFADAEGNPTVRVWEAESILSDNRIGPQASAVEKHSFVMPEGASNPIIVTAVLHYRSASQEHIDELFGEGTYSVPVIDMAAYPEKAEASTPGFGAIGTLAVLVLGIIYRKLKK
ncbi:cytochrome c family protein [Methanosarcina sp. KYL-1]|uniref:cytochrome c family protein n=1 Tax=Methanosarcina sp. KYL-1 TaxID=2602068 RepID=UPI0021013DA0|nr:cytochrome c family protein [Methanosarcina sp. KYL-1]MCQ1535203.1 cytochrome c family protein [Methanosarcina sp. KYL-1]